MRAQSESYGHEFGKEVPGRPAPQVICESPLNDFDHRRQTDAKPVMKAFLRWRTIVTIILIAIHSMATSQQSESSALGGPLKASAAESGLADANLRALETAIRSGDFKRITSVLVARHGKLAYEEYFEGAASTLRNTRSATKSITNALIGIDLDERKLSGVDAKVLALLPKHARLMQKPDPRKSAITVEDFLTTAKSPTRQSKKRGSTKKAVVKVRSESECRNQMPQAVETVAPETTLQRCATAHYL
jgi:hypothetical protein